MRSILTSPKNALTKQYQKLFAMDGVDLTFEDRALDAIVARARELGTGARGLRAVMEETMLDVMFDIHDSGNVSTCLITEQSVKDKANPVLGERKATA
jgi:ATP-dependent Clp protease ATP-binding subunit ClpX